MKTADAKKRIDELEQQYLDGYHAYSLEPPDELVTLARELAEEIERIQIGMQEWLCPECQGAGTLERPPRDCSCDQGLKGYGLWGADVLELLGEAPNESG